MTKKHFRKDIEGLRAVAVLGVLLNHILNIPAGGYLGVDVFFVISGYLITGLLTKEIEETGRISIKNFYIRRVRRIIPNAAVVITVTVAIAILVLPWSKAWETIKDGLWSSLFLGNWRFIASGTDYFGKAQLPSSLQHYWSLAVEEQFYVIWPVLIIFTYYVSKKCSRIAWRKIITFLLLLAISASLFYGYIKSGTAPTNAYFSTITRTWELGAGALIAIISPYLQKFKLIYMRIALSWIGTIGIIATYLLIDKTFRFPVPWGIPVVLCTCLVVIAFDGYESKGLFILTNRFSRWIGKISFSLYLWHWPVNIFLDVFFIEESDTALKNLCKFILSLLLAQLSFSLYEHPIHKSSWLEPKKSGIRRVIWPAIGILTGASLICFTTITLVHPQALFQKRANFPGNTTACIGANAILNKNCQLNDPSLPVVPSIDTFADDDGGVYQTCFNWKFIEPPVCHLGSTEQNAKRIMLLGDSHAAMYIPIMDEIGKRYNWSITTYTGLAYRLRAEMIAGKDIGLDPNIYSANIKNLTDPIDRSASSGLTKAYEALLNGAPYDAVILTGKRQEQNADQEAESLIKAWQPVQQRGTKLIAIEAVPITGKAAITCISQKTRNVMKDCAFSYSQGTQEADPFIQAAKKIKNAKVVSHNDLLCVDDRCPMVIGNVLVWRDVNSHITATYIESEEEILGKRFAEAMN